MNLVEFVQKLSSKSISSPLVLICGSSKTSHIALQFPNKFGIFLFFFFYYSMIF